MIKIEKRNQKIKSSGAKNVMKRIENQKMTPTLFVVIHEDYQPQAWPLGRRIIEYAKLTSQVHAPGWCILLAF